MKRLLRSGIELVAIAIFISTGSALVSSVFILRVVLRHEMPRSPVEGFVLGVFLVAVAVKMIENRLRTSTGE